MVSSGRLPCPGGASDEWNQLDSLINELLADGGDHRSTREQLVDQLSRIPQEVVAGAADVLRDHLPEGVTADPVRIHDLLAALPGQRGRRAVPPLPRASRASTRQQAAGPRDPLADRGDREQVSASSARSTTCVDLSARRRSIVIASIQHAECRRTAVQPQDAADQPPAGGRTLETSNISRCLPVPSQHSSAATADGVGRCATPQPRFHRPRRGPRGDPPLPLQLSDVALVAQPLHGLGGVGKSQIATEFAYRYQATTTSSGGSRPTTTSRSAAPLSRWRDGFSCRRARTSRTPSRPSWTPSPRRSARPVVAHLRRRGGAR